MLQLPKGTLCRTLRRANPSRLVLRLPTMVTAGLSLLSVLFFTAEIWDVTNALSVDVLTVFSLVAVGGATLALHKAFVRSGSVRNKTVVEATVVTEATSVLCLLLTILVLNAASPGWPVFGVWFAIMNACPKRLLACISCPSPSCCCRASSASWPKVHNSL